MTEVCKAIGIYIESLLRETYNINNVGLYWDDSLAVFKSKGGPLAEKIVGKKLPKKTFKNKGMNIVGKFIVAKLSASSKLL